jgi:polar amino acid transport system permease protein
VLMPLAGLFPDWAGPVFRYIIETGLPYTLKIAGVAVAGSAVVGIVFGTLLTIRFWPLRALIRLYIEVWRGLPLIVTLFLIVYALPQTVLHLTFQPWVGAAIGLTLWGSAQVAEATRRASNTRPPRRWASAGSAGTSSWCFRRPSAACCHRS